jgi:hypothetical protein
MSCHIEMLGLTIEAEPLERRLAETLALAAGVPTATGFRAFKRQMATYAVDKNKMAAKRSDAAVGLPQPAELSVRAENVLKQLATELTGEVPPPGRWNPPDELVEKLGYKHLSTARNCGPQTIAEIVKWAQTRGKTIQRPLLAGRSLSAMWHEVVTRFSSGEISKAEIAQALESSTRRRNTRIPVEFQKVLLQLINPSSE